MLNKMILESPSFWNFFDYARDSSFEMATDAFGTIHDVLTLHPAITGKFLVQNSNRFADIMSELMRSDNYVTKRQSLKIMALIINHRANYAFMTEYVDNVENLKLTMVLLRDKSKNIQYEAFNIFKVFVANPKKSKSVSDILIKNKLKLLNYLSTFHSDRKDDDTFHDEKAFIIIQISNLPNNVPSSASSAMPSAVPSASTSRRTSPTPGGADNVSPSISGNNSQQPSPTPPPGQQQQQPPLPHQQLLSGYNPAVHHLQPPLSHNQSYNQSSNVDGNQSTMMPSHPAMSRNQERR